MYVSLCGFCHKCVDAHGGQNIGSLGAGITEGCEHLNTGSGN